VTLNMSMLSTYGVYMLPTYTLITKHERTVVVKWELLPGKIWANIGEKGSTGWLQTCVFKIRRLDS